MAAVGSQISRGRGGVTRHAHPGPASATARMPIQTIMPMLAAPSRAAAITSAALIMWPQVGTPHAINALGYDDLSVLIVDGAPTDPVRSRHSTGPRLARRSRCESTAPRFGPSASAKRPDFAARQSLPARRGSLLLAMRCRRRAPASIQALLIQRDHLGSGVALPRLPLSSVCVLRMTGLCCGFCPPTMLAPSGGPRTRGRFGLNGRIGIWRAKMLDAGRSTH